MENNKKDILHKPVEVVIDRPMGSFHPEHKDLYYPVNYGYVEGILGGDQEEQDVYFLGIDKPVKRAEMGGSSQRHEIQPPGNRKIRAFSGEIF